MPLLFDDKHLYFSDSEHENGYAEIDGEIVKLSEHRVEVVSRRKEGGYLFIGTHYSCVLQTSNDQSIREFMEKIENNPKIVVSRNFKI
jgi:hypothetical protein